MKSIGIDIGTGSVSLAVVEWKETVPALIYQDYKLHRGDRRGTLRRLLEKMEENCPGEMLYGGVNHGFASLCPELYSESKEGRDGNRGMDRISALSAAARSFYPGAGSLMEIGAQSSVYITGLGPGQMLQYAMNGECAAGTGSFLEDQMYRLGFPLEEYSDFVRRAKSIPRLAGRCSVFAKTDLIHRQQEGIGAEDILLGLAYAMVRNFKTSVVRKLTIEKPLVLAGGVVYNEGILRAVKDIFNLQDHEIICNEQGAVLSAAGLAVLAGERRNRLDISCLWKQEEKSQEPGAIGSRSRRDKPGRSREPSEPAEAAKKADIYALPIEEYDKASLHSTRKKKEGEQTWLGVDAGSTSINLVWIGENKEVLDYRYLRTKGDPSGVVKRGLEYFRERYGEAFDPAGIGVTGSGRYLIARELGSQTVIDEITAQARAAAHFYPEAENVFEIGGQDSKYICLKNGQVVDFEMNKVCAAGTGSFIEEQADRLGIGCTEIGSYAMKADEPADLGERCTVLMESRIAAQSAQGVSLENICAGLCRSVVNNYLHRVVGNKPVGTIICLQGGIVHNEGIVAAFREKFAKRLRIMPYFDVTGAYGAAWEASVSIAACQDDKDTNRIKYHQNETWFLAGYDGTLIPGKKTVGIPRSLMLYKFFPMAYQYFKTLGFNVLLSKATDEEIIGLSQETAQEETCYPVKLLHGHMEALARQGVDYIFVPRVRTIKHAASNVKHNYGCVYMQTAPVLAAKALELEKRGIRLLSPLLDLDMGKPQMAAEMIRTGVLLEKDKISCTAALAKGAAAMVQCEKNSQRLGKEIMASLKPEDKVLVLITRNYGISDPVLNMGIPEELLKRGCKVLTLAHLEGHSLDLSEEYPNLYWPFSQHILTGAKIIKDNPNLYAVYLTNHGCGPDTMISHLFREIMGDKPYLSIEVDEHQSAVGVVTRIEAFLNSLRHVVNTANVPVCAGKDPRSGGKRKSDEKKREMAFEELQDMQVYLPPLSAYTLLYAKYLKSRRIKAEVLSDYGREDLSRGKAVSLSKEACIFSAAAGQLLRLAGMRKGETDCCYLFPQSEGAETEGFVPQILQAVLKRENLESMAAVYAPFLENVLEQDDSDQLWQCILLGDAFQYLKAEQRQCLEQEGFREISFPLTWEKTKKVLIEWKQYEEQGEMIWIAGSPTLLHSPYLNRELSAAIREHGLRPVPMMLSEYLWFWLKESGREIAKQHTLWMQELGELYPAASCGGDPEGTFRELEQGYAKVTGGNIRYLCHLCGRPKQPGEKGRILVTPANANYGSIMALMMENRKVPIFHYQPDANEEQEEIEKREIFLNYCEIPAAE